MRPAHRTNTFLAIAGLAICGCHAPLQRHDDRPIDGAASRSRVAFAGSLPSIDGARVKVTIVEVRYGPGESSPAHSHSCPVIGYVAEGAIRTRTRGGAEATYHVGETFYEAPNGVHLVSANASSDAPAKLIATFVCDHDGPLSAAVADVP